MVCRHHWQPTRTNAFVQARMVVRHIGAGRATPCGYYYGLERKEWLLRHEGAARPLLW